MKRQNQQINPLLDPVLQGEEKVILENQEIAANTPEEMIKKMDEVNLEP